MLNRFEAGTREYRHQSVCDWVERSNREQLRFVKPDSFFQPYFTEYPRTFQMNKGRVK